MCDLLGRQDDIESLQNDLVELQGAILEVFSRTGPVRFPSRKFPDQLSCHLDMPTLLEQYDYMDGEDAFNQHAHVVLQELVIDRLLLLLQSFNSYVVQLRSSAGREQELQKGCQSVGLVAKSYWTNLVEFVKMKESCREFGNIPIRSYGTKTKTPMSTERSSIADMSRHNLSACSSKSSIHSQKHVPPRPTHDAPCPPPNSSHHRGCQTIQSSLVPCDACREVQSALKQTGDSLVDLLDGEGLPSSLQPLLLAVEDTLEVGHMTAADVAQWGNEQLRDMRRLAKHLEQVRGTVKPLQERLAAAETERERFRAQLAKSQTEFKQKLDRHQATSVQLEFSLRKAERAVKETEKRLQEQQKQFQSEIMTLEETNSRLEEKVASQQDTLETLECDRSGLQGKVKTLQVEKEEECCQLQQTIQQLERQNSDIQLLLDKESDKYQSACREKESMHARQRSLERRISTLDEDCEDLQRELQERKELEMNQLQQMSEEKEELQTQLTEQQELCLEAHKRKWILEGHVGELNSRVAKLKEHMRSLRERERVLVAFPELTPLARAQPQTTGNVILDMKQQLEANNIRIEVLEQENATLVQSLFKLKERDQHDGTREHVPQQAWAASPSTTSEEEQQNPQTRMQTSPLQSSSVAQMRCSNRGKEASGGESDPEPDRSQDRVSSSHPALQINLQPLHLNTKSTAVQRNVKKKSIFLHPDCRFVNDKRK